MLQVNGDTLRAVAPTFSGDNAVRQKEITDTIGTVLASTLDRYAINTPLRIAHFIGQTCHESAGYRTTEEFASGAAYEGRKDLGNTQKGDGKRYKGRGILQLTGRYNYRKFGAALDLDLEENPEIAADPVISLRIACEYWKQRDINEPADADDLKEATRRINPGLLGLDERRLYTSRAKNVIASLVAVGTAATEGTSGQPLLHRGSRGDIVADVQAVLRQKHGFPIAVDGDFGPATELAVREFQKRSGLLVTGIVDAATWAKL